MNPRYSLAPPVEGGIQFWEINDLEKEQSLVSISVHFPNAEQVARKLYDELTKP